jgi:hypothetical protein
MLQVCQRANVIRGQVQLTEKFSVVWNLTTSLPDDLSKLLFLVESNLLRGIPLAAFEAGPNFRSVNSTDTASFPHSIAEKSLLDRTPLGLVGRSIGQMSSQFDSHQHAMVDIAVEK